VPYRAVEQNTRDKPSSYEIIGALEDHLSEEGKVEAGSDFRKSELREDVLDAVRAWLAEDPPHLQYIRGHLKLIRFFDRGLGESPEADQLRDDLDPVWNAMDAKQLEWVKRRVLRLEKQHEKAEARRAAFRQRRKAS
jgi:hypothetical protein